MCVVVIALVWIFGFQMNGDFWVSNERWLDGCLHFTDLCLWKWEGEKEKDIIIIIIVCMLCFQ